MIVPRLGRQQVLLWGALAGLFLLLLDRLILTPALAAWSVYSQETRQLRADVAQGQILMDQESRWMDWRAEAEAKLLPATRAEAESALLNRVDAWARASRLGVNSLRPRWRESRDAPPLLELLVNGTGSMEAIAQFLHQLETSPLALAVERIELTPGRQQQSVLTVDVRLSGLCRDAAKRAGKAP